MGLKSLSGYRPLLQEIKERIREAQYTALKAVNKELVGLYWDIGRAIVKRQKDEVWGKAVVENLARDLQLEFPGIQGFSVQNLWRMRQFHLAYGTNRKLSPLVREIGWTHNLIILMQCKDGLEREFYIRMTKKFGWTQNILIHQIETQTYERTRSGQTNFEKTVPTALRKQAKLAIKDEYTFDFLELGDEYSERQLEQALLSKVIAFLREMGGYCALVGNQYRLEISGNEYCIAILLFHWRLKCLVAVDLKVGKFQPEFVGKMQFYLAALDVLVREPDENPSIGIILCKSKDRTIVEYALRVSQKPIGVSSYRVVRKLPANLKGELPAPELIAKLMEE